MLSCKSHVERVVNIYKKYLKRFFDITSSLVMLPFLLFMVTILAPMIYRYDKGPVFYVAVRVGRYGRLYRMFKFRTMKTDAPDLRNKDGSTYNSPDDVRVTPVGRVMRRLSLDEVPQILNVLRGDMSIVGPRPFVLTYQVDELGLDGKARLMVRPGITGYAQAYFRNSITQREKIHLDAVYARRVSFCFDCKILIRTLCAVFRKDNIYQTRKRNQEVNN